MKKIGSGSGASIPEKRSKEGKSAKTSQISHPWFGMKSKVSGNGAEKDFNDGY